MLLALDASLCCTGWCIAPLPNSPVSELLCGSITTEPSAKRQRLYVAEDDAQRALKVVTALLDLKVRDPGTTVISEQPAGSRHARSASALKLIQGTLVGVRAPLEPIRWVTAQEVKVALTRSKNASKEQMVKAALRAGLKLHGNKADQEAQADALGVLMASQLWKPS